MNELNEKEIRLENKSNLVWIVNSKTDFWSSNTKLLAKKELISRNINTSEQYEISKEFLNWNLETEKEWEKIYLNTKYEKYEYLKSEKSDFTLKDKILITIIAPYSIFRKGIGPDLFSLYREKKTKMFWEKLLLLLLGIAIWFGIINYSAELSERKRIEGTEKFENN